MSTAKKNRTTFSEEPTQASIPTVIPWWEDQGFDSEEEARTVLRKAAMEKEAKVNAEIAETISAKLREGVTLRQLAELIMGAEVKSKTAPEILIKIEPMKPGVGTRRPRLKNAADAARTVGAYVTELLRVAEQGATVDRKKAFAEIGTELPSLNEKQIGNLFSRLGRVGVVVGSVLRHLEFSGSKKDGTWKVVYKPLPEAQPVNAINSTAN